MPESSTIEARIIRKSFELFSTYGYSRVRMDDVAKSLSMSKKTIYKYFPGKEILVNAVMQSIMKEVKQQVTGIIADDKLEFTLKVRLLFQYIAEQLEKSGRIFNDDLRTCIPELWSEIEQNRRRLINENFGKLFEQGRSSGTFRPYIDPDIVLSIFFQSIQHIINPATLTHLPYSASQAFDMITRIIFEGVLTDEGLKEYRTAIKGLESSDGGRQAL